MEIIPFIEKYRQDFIDINTDWIVSNFGALEEHDIESFNNFHWSDCPDQTSQWSGNPS